MQKSKKVGIYNCGSFDVELFMEDGMHGSFTCISDQSHIARITIGGDDEEWYQIISVVLHEIGELVRTIALCRYDRNNYYGADHASYMFFYDHTQFSDLCAREALFLAEALPDLARVWNKWKKDKKTEEKK